MLDRMDRRDANQTRDDDVLELRGWCTHVLENPSIFLVIVARFKSDALWPQKMPAARRSRANRKSPHYLSIYTIQRWRHRGGRDGAKYIYYSIYLMDGIPLWATTTTHTAHIYSQLHSYKHSDSALRASYHIWRFGYMYICGIINVCIRLRSSTNCLIHFDFHTK